jgi:NAD(P)-dependent dehydrogenase (short-subunit alcohol dehydrogenase family)
MAAGGARVLAVGRSPEKGRSLLDALRTAQPGLEHAFVAIDLSAMEEVSRGATEILRLAPRIDVLLHSAGVIEGRPRWTPDGLEFNFATNYVSRFLMTELLLPSLLRSSDGRVVIIASPGSHPDELDFEDLQLRNRWGGNRAFRQGQFANDLWAQALQRRNPSLTVVEVFPGLVKSNIFRGGADMPFPLRMAGFASKLFGLTVEKAAEVPVACALGESGRALRGQAVGPGLTKRKLGATVTLPERQDQLWNATRALVSKWHPT